MMDMYGFWRSQATFRVRVALNIKGVAYREIPVNLDKREQDDPAFRAINPMGGVPALMVGETPLTQSLAILEYIEETHPEPPLLPATPLERARVRALAAIAASDTHPLIVPRVRHFLADHAGFDAARWKEWQTQWFRAGLAGFEARLAREPETGMFCHGDRVTIADICLCGLYAGSRIFQIDCPAMPHVERIVERCMQEPAFDQARAIRQSDFPADGSLTLAERQG